MSNVIIIDYNKKRDSFEDYHSTGGAGMNYAGFECLNGIFQFAQDGITDFTGSPGSGKTELALELMFYQSEMFGLRHLVYGPDIGNYNEIRRKLIIKHFKRSFRGYYDSITQADLISCSSWIDNHFLIAGKADIKKPLTPIDLWNFAVDYRDDSGIINTCFIDSWKNLFHDYTGREDQYLDYVLSYRNELAENSKRHFITIAHPKGVEHDKDTKKPRIPTAHDISGGAAWFRNGKTILTVDWPDHEYGGIDVYFWKVKPDTIGRAKTIFQQLEFDWRKSRYRETIEGRICYAGMGKDLREKGEFIGFASIDKSKSIEHQGDAPF
jgi:hypothetical protein